MLKKIISEWSLAYKHVVLLGLTVNVDLNCGLERLSGCFVFSPAHVVGSMISAPNLDPDLVATCSSPIFLLERTGLACVIKNHSITQPLMVIILVFVPDMCFEPLNHVTFGMGFPPPDSQTSLTSWSSLKGPMWLLEMSFPSEEVILMYFGSAAKRKIPSS